MDCGSKKSAHAAEQDRADVARKRKYGRAIQKEVDPERLVFLNETSLKTDLTRLHGWAEGNERSGGDGYLSSHKSVRVIQEIEAVDTRIVHLPPYSPDLNPIENIFSKIK